MQDRELGRTGIRLPPIVFGTAPLASAFWGNDVETAAATLARALEQGVRAFDTAPLYGTGEAETRLGRALAVAGRPDVVLATKVGRTLVGIGEGDAAGRDLVFDFGADAVRRSLEGSLTRLGRSTVDVVHVHDPDDHLAQALDGAVAALVELRAEGVIRAVSVGTNSAATLAWFLERTDLDCALLAGRWTLLDRTGGEVLDACAERGVPVLAGGVFNSGLLADPRPGVWFDYAPAAPDRLARAAELVSTCARHRTDLRTAAVQFPLRHPAVAAVVLGMARPAEVDQNLASLDADLPEELWAELG
jgi:D-threo-aldose 1-dehydrogenase